MNPVLLEVITLRLGARTLAPVEKRLARIAEEAQSHEPDLDCWIFRSLDAPTDLSLHLRRRLVGATAGPTTLGLHVASGLAELGHVSHTVWTQVEVTTDESHLMEKSHDNGNLE